MIDRKRRYWKWKPQLIGCFLLLMACSEVIDLPVDQEGGRLVIFGRISNSTEGNQVSISRTTASGELPEPISGARVTIIDENGLEEILRENVLDPGVYRLQGNVLRGQMGTSYRLEVELNGRMYTTELQEMPRVVGEDTIDWELIEEDDISDQGTRTSRFVVNVYGSTTFNELPEEFYVRWNIEEVYTTFGMELPRGWFPRYSPQQCYIINDLSEQEAFLLDGTKIRDQQLGRQLFSSRLLDRSFNVRHFFNLIHSAINKETFEYWSKVNSLTARQGSIFDTPPAEIPGNITSSDPDERVLGFFEVIGVDTARTVLTQNDFPGLVFDDPCELTFEERRPLFSVPFECVQCIIDEGFVEDVCVFCSLLPNSTLSRPSYF